LENKGEIEESMAYLKVSEKWELRRRIMESCFDLIWERDWNWESGWEEKRRCCCEWV